MPVPFPDILFFQKNPSTPPVQILTDSIHCLCLLATKKCQKATSLPFFDIFPAVFCQIRLFYKCFYFLINALCIQTIFVDEFHCRTGLAEGVIHTDS